MAKIVKKQKKTFPAWILGSGSEFEKYLKSEKRIRLYKNGNYRLVIDKDTLCKESAKVGDYFTIDRDCYPHPIPKNVFESKYVHFQGGMYEDFFTAWESTEPITPELQFLLDKKELIINAEDPNKYFDAHLYTTWIVAPKDTLIFFTKVEKDQNGNITDVNFKFLPRAEFEVAYSYV